MAQYYELWKGLIKSGEQLPVWQEYFVKFYQAFIEKDRWLQYLEGMGTTLLVTAMALAIGVILGVIVAVIRTAHDQQRPGSGNIIGKILFGIVNWVCKIYVTVIRGTPVTLQLMIMYFIILKTWRNDLMIATVAFGINSGAYVAEIFRGGIMSIDNGQFEAGRSLGFNYVQTMLYIITPQVFKNVLPTLANEFITLLKETSVAGYVTVMDLTYAAGRIRGATFSPFMPLIGSAAIYLVLVMFFTWLVGKLERRLRNSER